MRNFKKIIKIVVFLVILFITYLICDFIFTPSGYVRVILHTLNHSDEKYDCIFLGASHGRSSLDPYKIDEQLGTNSLNLCIPSETIKDSYYLLQESCRNNNPKTVILDLDYQYWYDLVENDFSDAFIYYQMEPSIVKAKYLVNNLMNKDFRIVTSRWANYINNFGDIKKNVSRKLTKEYKNYDMAGADVPGADGPYVGKGFFFRTPVGHGGRGLVLKNTWNNSSADKETVKIFEDIVSFCNKKGIKLICITSTITPGTVFTKISEKASDYFTKLTKQYGVDYYDFNMIRQNVMPRTNIDFGDWDGHMSGKLAEQYSTIVGQVIKEQSENKLDRNKYFYESYKQLYDDTNTVVYCNTVISSNKNSDETYNLSFKVDSLQGTDIIPEFQVIVGTTNNANVIADFSTNANYSFNLPKGKYTVRINARAVGSSADFEEYCEKEVKLQ